MTIQFSQIDEGKRTRKEYGDLTGLKESLQRVGSIHPIVLSRKDVPAGPDVMDGMVSQYVLVAGGRRYRSMKELGTTELHHGSILEPDKLGFLFKDEVPEDELREAELDENLYRLKPRWQEDVLLIAEIHAMKKAKDIKWGVRQTAAILGAGYGRTNVSYAIEISRLIISSDKDILACPDMKSAISVMMKRNEDSALAEMNKRVMEKQRGVGTTLVSMGNSPMSFMDKLNTSLGPKLDALSTPSPAEVLLTNLGPQPAITVETAPIVIPLSSMFQLGDSFKDVIPNLPAACFDHIVTDIPYGIDMDNLTIKGKSDIVDQHEVEANISLMPVFLEQAFRLVKSGGFCVFFMDNEHFKFLLDTAKDIGWKTQDWVLIWVKTHNCRNGAPAFNFTKTYETAMVLRKDEKTVLRKAGPNSVWHGDGYAERKVYNNPFAKPFLLWKELVFDNIAFPGQSVYDPFWGEGSSSRAAANCGLIPYGSEISPVHYNRGIENMKSVYALINKSNCQFT